MSAQRRNEKAAPWAVHNRVALCVCGKDIFLVKIGGKWTLPPIDEADKVGKLTISPDLAWACSVYVGLDCKHRQIHLDVYLVSVSSEERALVADADGARKEKWDHCPAQIKMLATGIRKALVFLAERLVQCGVAAPVPAHRGR